MSPKDDLKLNKFIFEKRVGTVPGTIFCSEVGFFAFWEVVFLVVGAAWVVPVELVELVLDDEVVVVVVDSVASALT